MGRRCNENAAKHTYHRYIINIYINISIYTYINMLKNIKIPQTERERERKKDHSLSWIKP